jgi:hypothetical protein
MSNYYALGKPLASKGKCLLKRQIRDFTEIRLLHGAYDFGLLNCCNAVAMFLTSALKNSPPENTQNGRHLGGECLLYAHWLET